MSVTQKDVDVAEVSEALLAAYRSALNSADSLPLADKLLAQHYVAVSSTKAAALLNTRTANDQEAASLRGFATDAAAADSLATASGVLRSPIATHLAGILLGGLTVGGVAAFLLSVLGHAVADAAGAGAGLTAALATGAVSGGVALMLIRAAVTGAQTAQQGWADAMRLLQAQSDASIALQQNLNQFERLFFNCFGRRPPARPFIDAVQRSGGILLVSALVLGGILVLAFFSGASGNL